MAGPTESGRTAGKFDGGTGDDEVPFNDARFYGGPGNDKVFDNYGGTLLGNDGKDFTRYQYGRSVIGGPRWDVVHWAVCAAGTPISVEKVMKTECA